MNQEADPLEPAQRHPKADASRVAAADRWAAKLTHWQMKAPPLDDDLSWRRMSQRLGERMGYIPSAATREMIAERLAGRTA